MKKGIQASDLGRLNLEDLIFIQDSLGFNGSTHYPNPLNPSIKDKIDNVNLIGCQVKYGESPSYKLKKKDGLYIKTGCLLDAKSRFIKRGDGVLKPLPVDYKKWIYPQQKDFSRARA